MAKESKQQKLNQMNLLETIEIDDFIITRVHNGWIFKSTTKYYDYVNHKKCVGGSESMVFVRKN